MGLITKTASVLMSRGILALALIGAMTLVACGKKDEGANPAPAVTTVNQNVATVPPNPNTCFQTANASGSWYPYQQYGFSPYNIQNSQTWQVSGSIGGFYVGGWVNGGYSNTNASLGWPSAYVSGIRQTGFCGCGVGYMPVCDSTHGMICLPTGNLYNQQLVAWGYNGSNFAFNGYLGVNGPYNYYNQYGCSSTIGQTCVVGYNNTCGYGVCAPVQAGSNIGVCVR